MINCMSTAMQILTREGRVEEREEEEMVRREKKEDGEKNHHKNKRMTIEVIKQE